MEDPQRWIRIVLAVARLGDGDLLGWWGIHGLDRAGSYVLETAFPRTALAAGVDLLIVAAQRRQESGLGRSTALHLFSDHLPFARIAQAWIDETKLSGSTEELSALRARKTPDILQELAALSGDVRTQRETVASGLLLGSLSAAELDDPAVLDSVAGQFASAYRQDAPDLAIPYFDLRSS